MNSGVLSFEDLTSPASLDCPANTETQPRYGIDHDDSPDSWTRIERLFSSAPRTDRSQKAMVKYYFGSERKGTYLPLFDRQPGVNSTRHVVQSQAATEHLFCSADYHNYLLQPQTATVRLPPELLDDSLWTIVEIANLKDVLHSPAAGASDNQRSHDFLGVLAPDFIVSNLDRLFSAAHDEQFEAGVESRFSTGLQQLFQTDPVDVLDYLRLRLIKGGASPEVMSEMLEWVSRREARPLRETVVNLLSLGLCNGSPLVRDAAALGLAYLERSAAIGLLRQAIESEGVPELREDLTDLVGSLELEYPWQSSSGS